ncbi:MAG: hypothetical protein ABII27_00715 [bacterium]
MKFTKNTWSVYTVFLHLILLFFIISFTVTLIKDHKLKQSKALLQDRIVSHPVFNEIPKIYKKTDVGSLITIRTKKQALERRNELADFIWGAEGFPHSKKPHLIEKNIKEKTFSYFDDIESIDKITVDMDYGLSSVVYYLHPKNTNNKLIIYHQGHEGTFKKGIKTILYFIEKGYSVLAFSMPLGGVNPRPTVDLKRFGRFKLETHGHMKLLDHPVRFFVEPVAVVLNYIDDEYKYDSISMIGISGGGWTTTLYSAIDPRITNSYPVAGSCPIYLRSQAPNDWGDYEQTIPELYKIANYLELYILGSLGGGRKQLQILNRYDKHFGGLKCKTYEEQVKSAVKDLGDGEFDLYLDESHTGHKISKHALEVISENLGN